MVFYETAMQKYLQLTGLERATLDGPMSDTHARTHTHTHTHTHTAPERDTYVLPNAIYSVQQVLRDILMKTLDYKVGVGVLQ